MEYPDISSKTQLCMVIGDPVGHSLSPDLHNRLYDIAGLKGQYVFLAMKVSSGGLKEAMSTFRYAEVRGISVTIPHKQEVLTVLDEVDELALKIGAVNTVVYDKGCLKGYNTDVYGITEPLKRRTELVGRKILIIGAGGAARSAVFGLTAEGCHVTISNRSTDKGEKLAKESGSDFISAAELSSVANYDIILNATSVGMFPKIDKSPLADGLVKRDQIVFDLVYNPLETKLLKEADKMGAQSIRGIEMFAEQAARQFRFYTGVDINGDDVLGVCKGLF